MNANRLILAATAFALLGACAPRRPPPPQVSAPAPRAVPVPAPVVVAAPSDWRDAAITPGDWSYRTEAGGSAALFGMGASGALVTLRCDRAAPRVVLTRAGIASGQAPLTVITTTTARAFTALSPPAGAQPLLSVSLAPRDPLLDAIAFSRGRFAVETPGLATLYLPAWPEVSRVIEDCR